MVRRHSSARLTQVNPRRRRADILSRMNARTMRYLTIEQRESLRDELWALIARLRDEIARGMRFSGQDKEADDMAIADVEAEIEIAGIARASRTLREAVAALELLHHPGYGLCADCGAEIPFTRLKANPLSTRCVECQRKLERGALAAARL